MSSYIDDISYRVLIDGYGVSYPVRKSLKFMEVSLVDDPVNDQTLIYNSHEISATNLSQVLTVGNSAGNQKITNLSDPTFSQDAATKAYVDAHTGTMDHGALTGLNDDDHTQYLLANGTRDIDGPIAFSGDGYCLDNVGCLTFSKAHDPEDIPYEEGKIFYDTDNGTISLYAKSSNCSLQLGQEHVLYCHNDTASTILNGQPVYISGEHGNRPSISLASATSTATSDVIGLATEDINAGNPGYVTIMGLVHDVDTLAWPCGTRLYLSTTTGQLTSTPPTGTGIVMFVGIVTYQHKTQGIIAVAVKTPGSIQNMFDVGNGTPTDGYHLIANGTQWNSSLFSKDVYETMGTLTKDPTGFPIAGGGGYSTISKTDGTRTFTISPTGSTFDVYVLGKKFSKTSTSTTWTDEEGIHLFYFDSSGNLQSILASSETVGDLFIYNAVVAGLYWDYTNKSSVSFANERHGLQMDGYTHLYLHQTQGAKWSSGGSVVNITADGSGSSNTHAQFGFDSCIIWDEDLKLSTTYTSQILSNPAQIPVVFRSGASGLWRKKTADTYPLIQSGATISGGTYTGSSGLPAYNQWTGSTWQLTEVSHTKFFCVHYYMTSDVNTPIVGVLGQATYNNATDAKSGAKTELNTLQGVIRLFAAEACPLGTVLFQCSTSYSNAVKARVISPETGATYIDWRGTSLTGVGSNIQSVFDDSSFRIYDNSDATKQIAFQASGITTGNIRTLTIPDKDIKLIGIDNYGIVDIEGNDLTNFKSDGIDGYAIAGGSALTEAFEFFPTLPDGYSISTVGIRVTAWETASKTVSGVAETLVTIRSNGTIATILGTPVWDKSSQGFPSTFDVSVAIDSINTEALSISVKPGTNNIKCSVYCWVNSYVSLTD